ncbi:MAG: acetylornithine transaminase [Selenomonadaceae bacterium]|nr:acetylornithine transaminase [Selenomonadaceae bacterium]MBQ6758635.1 acetylornithine transaminase [Selenomonadaceae bacterium]MBR0103499.1 acetylornithine transaminase [Selenomonadaceae bacterium]
MRLTEGKIFEQDDKNYLPVFKRYKIVLERGEGAYLYDINGKRYIDFLAGIAVNVLGHNYPPLVKAIAEQAAKVIHVSNLYYTEPQASAAAKLVKLSGLDRAFFANSGAEANEGAIKIARKFAKSLSKDKTQIITAWNSFHGRTLATLTATGQPHYQEGLEPLPSGFDYVHFNDADELAEKISDKTCAVMLETIQGEGGVYPPKGDYLKRVRELCDKHGALLILDEIQSGMGRSGKFFAYEKYGIKPDIVTLAKGLAGGVPIGAFICTEEVAKAFKPGDHGTTFGGNPLACAAANVVLDTVPNEKFLAHVEEVGAYFKDKLIGLQKKYPTQISEIRGEGLILGAQLDKPKRSGVEIVNECMKRGAIINCTVGTVLRFIPPLIITREQVDEVINILDSVLEE